MYLYLNLFNTKTLESGNYLVKDEAFKQVKDTYSDYRRLSVEDIDGCIGYFNSKYTSDSCYALDVSQIIVRKDEILVNFVVKERLRRLNDSVRNGLYEYAFKNNNIKPRQNIADLNIVDKESFSLIKNETYHIAETTIAYLETLEALDSNEFNEVLTILGPIEAIEDNRLFYNNEFIVYNLAIAFDELASIKRISGGSSTTIDGYQESAIKFYNRCIELQPKCYDYYASVANCNYYKISSESNNVDDLDLSELNKTLLSLNMAIKLGDKEVRCNYQKADLILNYLIKALEAKFLTKDKDFFVKVEVLKNDALNSLNAATENYESLNSNELELKFKNYYLDSLYLKSKIYYYLEDLEFEEFVLNKISKTKFYLDSIPEKRNSLLLAKENLIKCFNKNFNLHNENEFNLDTIKFTYESYRINPIDIIFELGVIYFDLFYLDIVSQSTIENDNENRKKTLDYLIAASDLAYYGKTKGSDKRNLYYLNDKMSLYYIMIDKYESAIKFLGYPHNSYMLNTLAIALILKEDKTSLLQAESTLVSAINNKRNKELELSNILLLYCLKVNGKTEDYNELRASIFENINRISRIYCYILNL